KKRSNRALMNKLKLLSKLLRTNQYVKNIFIFAPLFFARELMNLQKIQDLLIAFVSFSLIASFVYIVNDVLDREKDKNHPHKSKRPIASGAISPKNALILGFIILFLGFSISFLWARAIIPILILYLIINLLYSKWLKNIALLDIVIVSFCYVIRLFVGSIVSEVMLSHWVIIMTFVLAMFLAIVKRRDDLKYENVRGCIDCYNAQFIDVSMAIMAGVIIICYISYTISPEVTSRFHCKYLYITAIYVLVGILRYIQIALIEDRACSPTEIYLHDKTMKIIILLWLATFLGVIY
ncbi:UbiA prenyltransferase family protein, partial [bacterium]|nr:UbiA prenyltransferase family protein [bacterium]